LIYYSIGGLVVFILDIVALAGLWGGRASIEHKLVWTLLILLLPFLGMVLYFVLGRSAADA